MRNACLEKNAAFAQFGICPWSVSGLAGLVFKHLGRAGKHSRKKRCQTDLQE